MKNLFFIVIVILLSLPTLSFSQEGRVNKRQAPKEVKETKNEMVDVMEKGAENGQDEMNEMQEQWMKLMAPKEEHKELARGEGNYTFEGKQWMMPGAEPMQVEGMTTSKMILGGRFLEENSKGNFGGMDFEGKGTTGYDNIKKEYVMTWMDNMSTSVSEFRGQMRDQVLTMFSKQRDPMSGEPQTHKIVVTFKEKGSQVMEYFLISERNTSFKMMELHYTKEQ